MRSGSGSATPGRTPGASDIGNEDDMRASRVSLVAMRRLWWGLAALAAIGYGIGHWVSRTPPVPWGGSRITFSQNAGGVDGYGRSVMFVKDPTRTVHLTCHAGTVAEALPVGAVLAVTCPSASAATMQSNGVRSVSLYARQIGQFYFVTQHAGAAKIVVGGATIAVTVSSSIGRTWSSVLPPPKKLVAWPCERGHVRHFVFRGAPSPWGGCQGPRTDGPLKRMRIWSGDNRFMTR
jgi:hypothetical protein